MAFSNSDWIVKLHYAFQDGRNVSFFFIEIKIARENRFILALYDYGLYARW